MSTTRNVSPTTASSKDIDWGSESEAAAETQKELTDYVVVESPNQLETEKLADLLVTQLLPTALTEVKREEEQKPRSEEKAKQIASEKKSIDDDISSLQKTLSDTLQLLEKLASVDATVRTQQLEEKFGLHTARSFDLVTELTRDLTFITGELLKPDLPPLSDDQKDEKAYQLLQERLKSSPALQELVTHIHQRSSFLKIGQNIGQDAKVAPDTLQLSAMTFNGAWLPEYFFNMVHFNPFLRHNHDRAEDAFKLFHELITEITSLDFIFFEEAWKDLLSEGPTRLFLKEQFTKLGYHAFGDETAKSFSLGSGLLGFSKHPIIDRDFRGFVKRRLGTETIAHKGVEGVKVVIDDEHVITLVTTHETSGDGLIKNDVEVLGTTSEMRGEEQQKIHNLIEEWADESVINPKTGKPYNNLGCIFAGDTNKTNNQLYQLLSLSRGESNNARKKDNIKYSGDFNNFRDILRRLRKDCWPIPRNAMDVTVPKGELKPGAKPVDPNLEHKAEQENLATGSTYSVADLTANRKGKKDLTLQTTEHHIIDMIAVRPNRREMLKSFESYLINAFSSNKEAISDHLALFAVMVFSLKKDATPLPTLSDKMAHTQFGRTEQATAQNFFTSTVPADLETREEWLGINLGS